MKELLNLLTSRRCHLCLSYTLKLASEGFANRGRRSRSCRSALYLALYSQLQGLGFYKICSSLGYSDRGTRLLCGVRDSPLITGQLSLEQLSVFGDNSCAGFTCKPIVVAQFRPSGLK